MMHLRVRSPVGQLLGVVFCALGCLKLVSGYREELVIPWSVFYCIALVEVACGVALIARRHVMASSLFAVCVGAGGVIVTLVHGERPCGCLGAWLDMSPRLHMVLACIVGGLGALNVSLCFGRPSNNERMR